jgi:hypothetical protein
MAARDDERRHHVPPSSLTRRPHSGPTLMPRFSPELPHFSAISSKQGLEPTNSVQDVRHEYKDLESTSGEGASEEGISEGRQGEVEVET